MDEKVTIYLLQRSVVLGTSKELPSPIGANVRVGLVSPPLEIKTLYAFHFLGVPLNSLSCIPLGACHNLMEKVIASHFPPCLAPAGLGLLSMITKVHDS